MKKPVISIISLVLLTSCVMSKNSESNAVAGMIPIEIIHGLHVHTNMTAVDSIKLMDGELWLMKNKKPYVALATETVPDNLSLTAAEYVSTVVAADIKKLGGKPLRLRDGLSGFSTVSGQFSTFFIASKSNRKEWFTISLPKNEADAFVYQFR